MSRSGETNLGCHLAILLYSDAERKIAEEVVHRMVKRAVEMEGTVTVSLHCTSLLVWFSVTNVDLFLSGRARGWPGQARLSTTRAGCQHGRCHEKGKARLSLHSRPF